METPSKGLTLSAAVAFVLAGYTQLPGASREGKYQAINLTGQGAKPGIDRILDGAEASEALIQADVDKFVEEANKMIAELDLPNGCTAEKDELKDFYVPLMKDLMQIAREYHPEVQKHVTPDDRMTVRCMEFFAHHGYFLNVPFLILGGSLFIPIEETKVVGINDSKGLSAIFPWEKVKEHPVYYVNDKSLNPTGMEILGFPVVNRGKFEEYKDDLRNKIAPKTPLWKEMPEEDIEEGITTNEMVHTVLERDYDLFFDSQHDWIKFEDGMDHYQLEETMHAHELLSDAGSIQITPLHDIAKMVDSVFNYLKQEKGAFTVDPTSKIKKCSDMKYEFDMNFMLHLLQQIYDRKGKGDQLQVLLKESARLVKEIKLKLMAKDIPKEVKKRIIKEEYNPQHYALTQKALAELDRDDVISIQQEFARMGRKLVEEIGKIQNLKGGSARDKGSSEPKPRLKVPQR